MFAEVVGLLLRCRRPLDERSVAAAGMLAVVVWMSVAVAWK